MVYDSPQSRRAFMGLLGSTAAIGLASAQTEESSFEEDWKAAKNDLGYSCWEYNDHMKRMWRYHEDNPKGTPEDVDLLNWWDNDLELEELPNGSLTGPDDAVIDNPPITGETYRLTTHVNANPKGPYADLRSQLEDYSEQETRYEMGWAFGYMMEGTLKHLAEYRDNVQPVDEGGIKEAIYHVRDAEDYQAVIELDEEALETAANQLKSHGGDYKTRQALSHMARPMVSFSEQPKDEDN